MKKVSFGNARTILDVGTGIGQVVAHLRNKGFEAYGTDITDNAKKYWEMGNITRFCQTCPAHELPFEDNAFDIVICTEVLEHIPEQNVEASLREMYRVGRGDFIMTYATGRAVHKMPTDGTEPHITIKPMSWWTERFLAAGYTIIDLVVNGNQSSVSVFATKGKRDAKGKMPAHTLHLQSKQGVPLTGNFARMAGGAEFPRKGDGGLYGVRSV
jgi:SAM-dependent methyltransferase